MKAIVIVGPTGVGKTGLGLEVARHYGGEIVSADSVQVFKRLDIISGKDKEDFKDSIVHLIDIVSPTESFSVSQFEKLALQEISKIIQKRKLPIIVGGTGLYIRSIIDGIESSNIKPNLKLRLELEAFSLEELQKKLMSIDKLVWAGMNESDRKNSRRIIRKIEILKNGRWQMANGGKRDLEFLQVGLGLAREEIKKRIDIRVMKRIEDGAIDEASDLYKNYKNLTSQIKDANGYKQFFGYFQGEYDLNTAIEKWKISEYKHAKNQMTWFRKDKRIKWYSADDKDLIKGVRLEIDRFLDQEQINQ